jgi:hypothetical protein
MMNKPHILAAVVMAVLVCLNQASANSNRLNPKQQQEVEKFERQSIKDKQRNTTELPKSMLGPWCFAKTEDNVWGKYWLDYFENKCEDHMKVTPSGYWFPGATGINCDFIMIKKIRNGYQTRSKCVQATDKDFYYKWESLDTWDNPFTTSGTTERPWLRKNEQRSKMMELPL